MSTLSPVRRPERVATTPTNDLLIELGRLRERFVANEGLDQQLDDVVARLTALLQGAVDFRKQTRREIDAALSRCEELLANDRSDQRALLTSLARDLDATRDRTRSLGALLAGLNEQLERLTIGANGAADPADVMHANGAAEPDRTAHANRAAPPEPAPAAPIRSAAPPSRAVVVTIQDVPSIAVALSLQRFFAGLEGVEGTETREYAAGELSLNVQLTCPLRTSDLRRWPEGELAVVAQRPHGLVLRLTGDAKPANGEREATS